MKKHEWKVLEAEAAGYGCPFCNANWLVSTNHSEGEKMDGCSRKSCDLHNPCIKEKLI